MVNDSTPEYIKKAMNIHKKGKERFGSPGHSGLPSDSVVSPAKKKKLFMKDMKRHGILWAVNEVNKFTEFFEIGSPPREPENKDLEETKEDVEFNESAVFPFQRWARSHSPPKQ